MNTDTALKTAKRVRPFVVKTKEMASYLDDNGGLLHLIAEAFDAGDWKKYIFNHQPQWQFDALLGAIKNGLSGEAYWQQLTDVWVMRGPGLNAELWLILYRRDVPPGRRAAMDADELAVFDALPETLTLYRGARPDMWRGLSWSLKRGVAARFVKRTGGKIFTVQVPRRAALAFYNSRKESEVLVDPSYLPDTYNGAEMTTILTIDEIEAHAPELWALTNKYALETSEGAVDFDMEIFDAIDMLLQGATETVVLSKISPDHPGAAEATELLRAHLRDRRVLN